MQTELRLQQNCYLWFHNTYPQYRGLFFKVKNEGTNRISGARDKATGTVAGVSDMILLLPGRPIMVEFKTETGKQSQAQHEWEKIVKQAGYEYVIIRSEEQFKEMICLPA